MPAEIGAVFRLSGNGERAQSAPVEGVFERDDLKFIRMDGVAVGPRDFESAFHGFRARVGEKGPLQTADLRQSLGQRALVLVVIQVRTMDHEPGLLANGLDDTRIGVPQGVDADASHEI